MNTSELETKLLEEGCNPNNFCIGCAGVKSDIYCLSENNGKWKVYYTERGSNSEPIYESSNETEACEFYYKKMMSIEHWHNVGFFESEESALKLQQELGAVGINAIRNDMPASKAGGPKIRRVFVEGKDILTVKDMYASLPIKIA